MTPRNALPFLLTLFALGCVDPAPPVPASNQGDMGSDAGVDGDTESCLTAPVRWKFDVREGDTFPNDGSIVDLDAVVEGEVSTIAGVDGSGIALSQANMVINHLSVSHHPSLEATDGTVSIWVKPSAPGGVIVSKDGPDFGDGGHFRIRVAENGTIKFRLQGDDTDSTLESTSLVESTGDWTHIAVSFGALGMQLFVDGVLEDSDESFTGGLSGASFVNERPLIVGAGNGSSMGGLRYPYEGDLDELQMWPEQLDRQAIEALADCR